MLICAASGVRASAGHGEVRPTTWSGWSRSWFRHARHSEILRFRPRIPGSSPETAVRTCSCMSPTSRSSAPRWRSVSPSSSTSGPVARARKPRTSARSEHMVVKKNVRKAPQSRTSPRRAPTSSDRPTGSPTTSSPSVGISCPSVERIMNAGLNEDGTVETLTLFRASLGVTNDPPCDPSVAITARISFRSTG